MTNIILNALHRFSKETDESVEVGTNVDDHTHSTF